MSTNYNLDDFRAKLEEYSRAREHVLKILDHVASQGKNISREETEAAFLRISDLGPIASRILGNVIRYTRFENLFRQSLEFLKPHLEICLKEESFETRKSIVNFLGDAGENGVELLEHTFKNDPDNDVRFGAAYALAKMSGKGLNVLINAIDGGNSQFQKQAILGISQVIYEESEQESSKIDREPFVKILNQHLNHNDSYIRIVCIKGLSRIHQLPIEIISQTASDSDPNVRYATLEAIRELGIKSINAPLFVRFLEDPVRQISELAHASINKYIVKEPDSIAIAIVEILILRQSGLPKENFNTKLVVSALQETIELNPIILGRTLHMLRDLAYSNYDNNVMPRCVFVGQALNKKEFTSLISEKASEAPSLAAKIFQTLESGKSYPTRAFYPLVSSELYVSPDRINELKALKSKSYDLLRLIKLCEEVNICYQSECYLAVTMLVRAILDHVPPIFGFNTFTEVANNHGGRSTRRSFLNLQNSSRNISDSYLHQVVRAKEILPNSTQVNFINDLDVLLSEIVRLLK